MMTYDNANNVNGDPQVYSQEKHADISQLKDEVDQIRLIMNRMRQSNNTDVPTMYAERMRKDENNQNDIRSSLLSILSKNKGLSGENGGKPKMDADTLKALLGYNASSSETGGNGGGLNQFSPNLQMFESIISNMTGQQQQTQKSATKTNYQPRFAEVESMDGATNIVMGDRNVGGINTTAGNIQQQPGNEFSFDKQRAGAARGENRGLVDIVG